MTPVELRSVRSRSARTRSADAAGDRILDAALACIAHYGVSKTTVEDVAEAAGCSRATLYRYFPGKVALLDGVMRSEIQRVAAGLHERLGDAATLDDLLTGALVYVGEEFASHEALQHVLAVEPEILLPYLAFDGAQQVFATAALVLAPHLARFLAPEDAAKAGEWVGRVALTYLCCPSEHVSLTHEDSVRYLVRTFVLPGLHDSTPRRG